MRAAQWLVPRFLLHPVRWTIFVLFFVVMILRGIAWCVLPVAMYEAGLRRVFDPAIDVLDAIDHALLGDA